MQFEILALNKGIENIVAKKPPITGNAISHHLACIYYDNHALHHRSQLNSILSFASQNFQDTNRSRDVFACCM